MSALERLWAPDLPWNHARLRPAAGRGHVESWFVRANHPTRPLALWLKATIFVPLAGPALAETWFIWFDGEKHQTVARRVSEPLEHATFAGDEVRTSYARLWLGSPLTASGALEQPQTPVRFTLTATPPASPFGARLQLYPDLLLRGPFPKSKLVTPSPVLFVSGSVELGAQKVELDGWVGMQGHNWGPEHPFEYAWGQCVFPNDEVLVEGFTGRVRVAGRTTPQLSALVVRRGARTYRFDRLFDAWRQRAAHDGQRWSLSLLGPDGDAELTMSAEGRPMVCLGYDNPDAQRSYCLNSKLAHTTLTVRPADGASFTCVSEHGGALEFLSRTADPRFPHPV